MNGSDEQFNFREFPLAYLITLRSVGTWLHGDERSSVDRPGLNVHGSQRRPANPKLRYLWKPEHVARVNHYVLYEQGEDIPSFED